MKTKQADAVKLYSRRDSATAVLRKLGIKPRDYNYFIEQLEDGCYACQVERAKAHLAELVRPKPRGTERRDGDRRADERRDQDRRAIKPPKRTISSVARAAILDGKTNGEVFVLLQQEFGEDRINEDKAHYPSWYRAELKRKGQLPPAFQFTQREQGNVRFIDGDDDVSE